MFEPMQYGQSYRESSRNFDRSKQIRFETIIIASGKELKKNENINSNDSFLFSRRNQDELDTNYYKTNYESFRIKFKSSKYIYKLVWR